MRAIQAVAIALLIAACILLAATVEAMRVLAVGLACLAVMAAGGLTGAGCSVAWGSSCCVCWLTLSARTARGAWGAGR